jgi:hypothetical protein
MLKVGCGYYWDLIECMDSEELKRIFIDAIDNRGAFLCWV